MEIYFTRPISNKKWICIGTLTDQQLSESGALERFGSIGYFLYERDIVDGEEEIEVIASITSEEAAERLLGLLSVQASVSAQH